MRPVRWRGARIAALPPPGGTGRCAVRAASHEGAQTYSRYVSVTLP
ncbi:hypothetical protein [Streptomyces asiaticus]